MKNQDFQDLKQLVEFLKEQDVAEFDLDRGDLKIRLKFSQPAVTVAPMAHMVPGVPAMVNVCDCSAVFPPWLMKAFTSYEPGASERDPMLAR